jgi:ribosomal protein S18 acetylase RimI-like enzyme
MTLRNNLGYNPAMHQLAIRPMMAEDIPLVVDWMLSVPLWQRYQVNANAARAQFEHGLRQGDILLVSDRGVESRAVGFTWCLPDGAFGLSAYLRLIGVRPDHARFGIGTALLAQTERLALRFAKDIFLLVSDFNVDAQRFYQRHGYTQMGAIPAYVLPDVTELIFRKKLQNVG